MKKNYRFTRWVFTWNADAEDWLPEMEALTKFLNEEDFFKQGAYQLERGNETGRRHLQGRLELRTRSTKKKILEKFATRFVTTNLTVEAEQSSDSTAYCLKSDTKIGPTQFFGPSSYVLKHKEHEPLNSFLWQKQAEQLLFDPNRVEELRDRNVVVIYDPIGNNGKSSWLKNIRLRIKSLTIRKLSVDRADRTKAAAYKKFKREDIDILVVDLPRTHGDSTDLKGFFEALEDIKNGWVEDTMYGNANEGLFDPPVVLIMTNMNPVKFVEYMSMDRWIIFEIANQKKFKGANDQHRSLRALVPMDIIANPEFEPKEVDTSKNKYTIYCSATNPHEAFRARYGYE